MCNYLNKKRKVKTMKKIITLAAAAVVAGFAFAEGWSVGGYFRSGAEANTDAKDFETKTFKDGCPYGIYGNMNSRVRLNVNYTQEDYGFKFRYQCTGFGVNNSNADVWFNDGNLKYMYGYAKFLDGKIIGEAGKLSDSYTDGEGIQGFSAMDGYGLRALLVPVEGLYLSAAGTTYRAEKYKETDKKVVDNKAKEGDIKANEKLITLSAKYKNDAFTVAGGHNFAGESYGYFELKTIPNFTLKVEGKLLDKDISGKKDKKGKDTSETQIWEQVQYKFNDMGLPLEAGIYCGQKIVKDDNIMEFYPYMSYALNEVVSPELEAGIIKYADKDRKDRDGDEYSMTYNVTPSLKIKVGKKTTIKVYYNYDKNDKSAVGTTMKVNF